MNYGVIKKKSFDILSYRISVFLNVSFDVLFGSYFIFTLIYYGEPPISVIVAMLVIPVFLLSITTFIYFVTKKTVVFSEKNVLIGGYEYAWYSLNLEFNFEIIPPIWNTVCISYYDYKKRLFDKIYIKCKKDEFDIIMSLRNFDR